MCTLRFIQNPILQPINFKLSEGSTRQDNFIDISLTEIVPSIQELWANGLTDDQIFGSSLFLEIYAKSSPFFSSWRKVPLVKTVSKRFYWPKLHHLFRSYGQIGSLRTKIWILIVFGDFCKIRHWSPSTSSWRKVPFVNTVKDSAVQNWTIHSRIMGKWAHWWVISDDSMTASHFQTFTSSKASFERDSFDRTSQSMICGARSSTTDWRGAGLGEAAKSVKLWILCNLPIIAFAPFPTKCLSSVRSVK